MAKGFGVSPITNTIYYGTQDPVKHMWTGKKEDVTDGAIAAVYEWFIGNMEDDMEEYFITYPSTDFELAMRRKQKTNDWISCSERLPKCNGCYLVWRPHFFGGEIGMPAICYFDGQDTWHDSYGVDFTRILNKEDVLAWMELPESYKG